jgi:hypothetical protein
MAFTPDRNEVATNFKKRIAIAKTEDLVPLVAQMQKKVYFSAQLPFLLEELECRGHPVDVTEQKDSHGLARAFIIILIGVALVMLFFDGYRWLRDMISSDLTKLFP